jgi:hypothetical protein
MRFIEHRPSMGSSTEVETQLAGLRTQDPAHRLFVTPPVEVETLCRLALLRYLEGYDEELAGAAAAFFSSLHGGDDVAPGVEAGVWSRLKMTLARITLFDPACGEAHMLVGALALLDGLMAHADRVLGIDANPHIRRLTIVQHNLFGVEAQRGNLLRAQEHLHRAVWGVDSAVGQPASAHLMQGDSLLRSHEFRATPGFRQVMESGGFQVVLGNPPYVRHERISDPLDRLPATEYKRQVFAAAEAALDAYCPGVPENRNPRTALSRRSDLSVLFTIVGLSFLAPGGVLGFVLPNAISSARYGEALWHLLGTDQFSGQLVENLTRRPFANAAVNTALLVAQRRADAVGTHSTYLAAACEHFPTELPTATAPTVGRRSHPELTVDHLQGRIEQCCTPLQSIGRLKYPIKTGLNCFFYPDPSTRAHFRIEQEFLIPVVKSPRDVQSLVVPSEGLRTVLFHCPHSRDQLRELGATGAIAYISWGEDQTRFVEGDGDRDALSWPSLPSLRGRVPWYSLALPPMAHLLCPRFFHRRFFFALPTDGILLDQTFYGLELATDMQPLRPLLGALLNSSLGYLMLETHGRTGLGDGVRQFALRDMADLPVPDPARVDPAFVPVLIEVFEHLATRPILSIEDEVQQVDRRELDDALCRALGLSATIGAAARDHLTALVRRRLERVRSR